MKEQKPRNIKEFTGLKSMVGVPRKTKIYCTIDKKLLIECESIVKAAEISGISKDVIKTMLIKKTKRYSDILKTTVTFR